MAPLNLFILIGSVVIVGVMFALYMRKASNRHPMDSPRGRAIERGENPDRVAPPPQA